MTELGAIEFCKKDPQSAAKIILMVDELKQIIAKQEERIKELEAKLNMNSSNSISNALMFKKVSNFFSVLR